MPRERLPTRRPQTTVEVAHGSSVFTVGIGALPGGRVAEIFVSGSKAGSELDALLNDAAVLASIALQYGAPLDTLARAMGRHGDKTAPASALGAILDAAAKDGRAGS